MGRTAKDLHGERGLNAACAFLQISDVLFFGFTDAAQRGAKADADALLRFFARILDARVGQREPCRYDCELRVTIETFQTMRQEKFFRIPIANLACASHVKHAGVEACDAINTTFFRQDSIPKIIHAGANACDGTNPGDDRASPGVPRRSLWRGRAHAVTLFALAST